MVIIYSQPLCNPCTQTKKFLDRNEIEYEDFDVTMDPKAYEKIVELGYRSTPVILTESGEHWAGFDLNKMKELSAK